MNVSYYQCNLAVQRQLGKYQACVNLWMDENFPIIRVVKATSQSLVGRILSSRDPPRNVWKRYDRKPRRVTFKITGCNWRLNSLLLSNIPSQMVNKILACYQDMPSQRWRGQVWGSEVLSHGKVGLVTERSADRCNHGLGNQGHLRYSTGDSKERHSPRKDI